MTPKDSTSLLNSSVTNNNTLSCDISDYLYGSVTTCVTSPLRYSYLFFIINKLYIPECLSIDLRISFIFQCSLLVFLFYLAFPYNFLKMIPWPITVYFVVNVLG